MAIAPSENIKASDSMFPLPPMSHVRKASKASARPSIQSTRAFQDRAREDLKITRPTLDISNEAIRYSKRVKAPSVCRDDSGNFDSCCCFPLEELLEQSACLNRWRS